MSIRRRRRRGKPVWDKQISSGKERKEACMYDSFQSENTQYVPRMTTCGYCARTVVLVLCSTVCKEIRRKRSLFINGTGIVLCARS